MDDKFYNKYRVRSARATWWNYENEPRISLRFVRKTENIFLEKLIFFAGKSGVMHGVSTENKNRPIQISRAYYKK